MKKTYLTLVAIVLLISSCTSQKPNEKMVKQEIQTDLKKIPILNFGTFHMGKTADANKTEFDEHDKKNQKEVHKIAAMLATFKPTVIIVETPPSYNEKLQSLYEQYINNPKMEFKRPDEVELLAYELGRLSNTKRIYGIDHKMGYNYNIANELKNEIDSITYIGYDKEPLKFHYIKEVNLDSLNLLEKLKLINQNQFLNYLIEYNADILTHIGSKDNFEGADEAAKYYQRNLRMYSNLNRIQLNEDDRVFILMGASHTAFFRGFISRSPKYKMVNTFDYLK